MGYMIRRVYFQMKWKNNKSNKKNSIVFKKSQVTHLKTLDQFYAKINSIIN